MLIEELQTILKDVLAMTASNHSTGSNYICNPPVTNTDIDFLLLIGEDIDESELLDFLEDNDFEQGGSRPVDDWSLTDFNFVSYKRGNLNFIITADKVFYDKFVYATKIAKLLNLVDKDQRVKLFQAVLYDNFTENFV